MNSSTISKIGFEPYSALVAVYSKESPNNLRLCIDSVFSQTVPPDEFVLVCDGPLTDELNALIHEESLRHPSLVTVRLPYNRGAAIAFEEGSKVCTYDLIMKLGSDDRCRPERAELQLTKYAEDPSLVVVGGFAQMFAVSPGDSEVVKSVPCSHDEILLYAKRRNPFNDATVMYRRAAFEQVGGYSSELRRAQDYDIYVRILSEGYRTCNISHVLADCREDEAAIRRRRTWEHFKCFVSVHWKIYKSGFCNVSDLLVPCIAQASMVLLPSKICSLIYRKVLRVEVSEPFQKG